jgi:hypothetical protein
VPRAPMSQIRVSSLRSERLAARLARVGLAALVYLGGFELLHHGFYAHNPINDTPLYQGWGFAMRGGQVPYRDFAVEYPPGALPVFLAPTFLTANYPDGFWWLMAALGVCCLVLVAACRPPRWALPLLAVSPLLIGSYLPTRFDLWPTLLLLAALAAFLRDHHRLGWVALAAAFSAKLFPVVVMPIAALWTLRRGGRAELLRSLALAAAVLAGAFAPFAVLAPHGLFSSLWGQFSRPLQIESLGAAFLMSFGHPHVIVSHGSLNLSGHGSISAGLAIVAVIAVVALWLAFARGPAEPERFVRLATACVCAFIAFGKVLSPQFLIWLVPLVPLVRGRRGLAACGLLVAALLDTEVWFPGKYFAYVYHSHLAWLVLARDLLLVALLVVLSWPQRGPTGSSARARRHRIRRARPRFSRLPRRPRAAPETP